jgi:cyclopropane-fatty-acyl-phospholipid synthase
MKLGEVFAAIAGPDAPVEFIAYDGSKAGIPGSPVRVEILSERAVDLVMSHPGQVGLARAYVAEEIEIVGDILDLFEGLSHVRPATITWPTRIKLGREFAPSFLRNTDILRRGDVPQEETKLDGRRHSKIRDAEAIKHHYDVSNTFYRWVLGPSMAYTCAVFSHENSTLEEAQEEKFDLVCRKLGLKPGMRLLDVGCGWGGMVLHAAKNYGVEAIGVTLSEEQAQWGQQAVVDAGLEKQAQVRFSDYRDVPESGFDAISSIGLTEHIGEDNYPAYFEFLRSKARPHARLLNHSITRFDDNQKVHYRNSFINRYIFPDGELTGPAKIMTAMTAAGWEVRHEENIREHYAKTLNAWRRNLEDHWEEAVAEVGIRKARVWRLYMAAAEFGFMQNVIQLHQFLGVNTDANGIANMPLRPDFSPS